MISAKEVKQQIPIPGRKLQLQHQGWPGMGHPDTIYKILVKKPGSSHTWKGFIQFYFFDDQEWWTAVIDHNTRTGMMPSFQRNSLKDLLDFIQNRDNDSMRVKVYEVLEMERV